MATSALNNASENSILSDPAGDKVAADGTGKGPQEIQLTALLTIPQASFSSTLGFPFSKMPCEAVTLTLRSGSRLSMRPKVDWRSSVEATRSMASLSSPIRTLSIGNGPQMPHRQMLLETSVSSSLQHQIPPLLTGYLLADGWNREATPMTRGEYGVWEVLLPAKDGQLAIPHNSKIKVIGILRYTKLFTKDCTVIYGHPIGRTH